VKLFNEMQDQGIKPDSAAYSSIINTYSHTKMVDKATQLFEVIPPSQRDMIIYNNMVDVLARAGDLKAALTFIEEKILTPNLITWMTFLGACRTYGNLEMAKFAAEKALELRPKHPAVYVMLSNIYAAQGMWDEQAALRKLMGERNVKKVPGMSWIEIGGKTHTFLVNDTGHPHIDKIMEQIEKMKTDASAAGFVADTCFVLHDIEEEQKLDLLWYHSEKLALAYGFLMQKAHSSIRISKNLRVCGDCHSALMLFSKLYQREFFVRDRSRQHHFKNGACSCNQFW
jgi:tetratricopeptide (TPR) repeat protein